MNVQEKFNEIHNDLSHNVTKIYGRNDILTAFDLTYHSVLGFYFQGKLIKKGWVEALIVGDTRCGKTETAERIINHYQLGEISSGENTSFSGIVGGLQQTQKRWNIIWGKLPLNDRRLLVIDEVSGLKTDDIANMSSIRSSGIAEITKIQTEKTFARTRLIWLSNPRLDQAVNFFNSGIDLIRNLIGKPEDIARFDFALILENSEVPIETINNGYKQIVAHKYTNNACKNLILWAWSRKPEEVIIDEETTEEIVIAARTLCGKYLQDFPIVTQTEQKIKVARLSIATAARLYSTRKDSEIFVRPEHVSFVYHWLDRIYSTNGFAYDLWSKAKKNSSTLRDPEKIKREFARHGVETVDALLEMNQIRVTDLEEIMGIDRSDAKALLSILVKKKAIRKRHSYYIKTPAFIGLLRWMQNNGVPEPTAEGVYE